MTIFRKEATTGRTQAIIPDGLMKKGAAKIFQRYFLNVFSQIHVVPRGKDLLFPVLNQSCKPKRSLGRQLKQLDLDA